MNCNVVAPENAHEQTNLPLIRILVLYATFIGVMFSIRLDMALFIFAFGLSVYGLFWLVDWLL